ncbi:unnamed protein product [Cunninghamella blakesleeana]
MSKLPKSPFDFNMTRKRNTQNKPTSMVIADNINDEPNIGDRVLIEGKQVYGTLKYIGPIDIKPGVWAGIELDDSGTGKNNGSVNGVYYFNCPANSGIFVLKSKVILVSRNSIINSSPTTPTPTKSMNSISSMRKKWPNKNGQRTVSKIFNVTPNVSPTLNNNEEIMVVQKKLPQPPSVNKDNELIQKLQEQIHQLESSHLQLKKEWNEKEKTFLNEKENYKKEITNYQVKLGREQHKVYELRKEREQIIQKVQDLDHIMIKNSQMDEQLQSNEKHVQQLEKTTLEQKDTIFQLRNDSNQLLEQQSELIHELQKERYQHDQLKSNMKQVEQLCQLLMDPLDVKRPGLDLIEQLKQSQYQLKEIISKSKSYVEEKQNHQREVNRLHRDISNLEALIEGKIFKESELLESLELEKQLNKQLQQELKKKSPKRKSGKKSNIHKQNPTVVIDTNNIDPRWTIGSGGTLTTASTLSDIDDDDVIPPYCEICETVGHDLMTCVQIMNHSVSNLNYMVPKPQMDTLSPIHHQHQILPSL